MSENWAGARGRVSGTSWLGLAALGAIALGLAPGCDSQADPDYRGEPLLSVTGQVEAALSVGEVEVGILWLTASGEFDLECIGEVVTASGEPSACVAACGEITCDTLEQWADCAQACADVAEVYEFVLPPADFFLTGGIGQTTPAVGEFPAQFSLDILEPPPPSALLRSRTGERLAVGLFVALDPVGAPFTLDSSQPGLPSWLLGSSSSHALLFAPDGIPEGSVWAQGLLLTLAPGYQLMQMVPVVCDPPSDDCGGGTELLPVPDASASEVNLRIGPPIALPLLSP